MLRNWYQAGFRHVNDFFDQHGSFINPDIIIDKLHKRTNWICEYIILRDVLGSIHQISVYQGLCVRKYYKKL